MVQVFQWTEARKRFMECFVPRYLIPYEGRFNFHPFVTPTLNPLAIRTSDVLAQPTRVLETISSFATPRMDLETMDLHAPPTMVFQTMNSLATPRMDLDTMDSHAPPTMATMDLETVESHAPPTMYLDAATNPYPKKRRTKKQPLVSGKGSSMRPTITKNLPKEV